MLTMSDVESYMAPLARVLAVSCSPKGQDFASALANGDVRIDIYTLVPCFEQLLITQAPSNSRVQLQRLTPSFRAG